MRYQQADVVVLVQLGDLALEHAGPFGSNDRIGEAMKFGREAPALPVQIPIRDRHVEDSLGSLAAAGRDPDVGISACTAIAVHGHPFANHGERRIKGVLIRISLDRGGIFAASRECRGVAQAELGFEPAPR